MIGANGVLEEATVTLFMEDSAMVWTLNSAKSAEKSGAIIFIVIPLKYEWSVKLQVKDALHFYQFSI